MYGKVYEVRANSKSELASKLGVRRLYQTRHGAEQAANQMNYNVVLRILRQVTKMTGTVRGQNQGAFQEAVENANLRHYEIVEITVNR
jgi:hypothetical protein